MVKTKRISWTFELALSEAKKYNTKNEFKINSPKAYNYARRAKILNIITIHMKKRFIWSFDLALIEAKKYKTKKEFSINSSGAYSWGQKHKLLDHLCSHMKKTIKWDYKSVKKEAMKYKSRGEFQKKAQGAYRWAIRNSVLDDITKHMPDLVRWNIHTAKMKAKEYSSRQDLFYNASGLYSWAFDNNCLSDICSHMPDPISRGFNPNKSGILYYIRIDKDGNTVYKIGITNNSLKRRFRSQFKYISLIHFWEFENGADARKLEKEILTDYAHLKYKGPDILKDGNTEMFIDDILMLDKSLT